MIWHPPLVLARDWGEEVILLRTATHCGKLLRRRAGTAGGLQFHVKEESHYLLSGRMGVTWDGGLGLRCTVIEAGTGWTVPPFTPHREEALTDAVVIEVSDPTVNDRVRLDAQYGEPTADTLPSMSVADGVRQLWDLARALRNRADEAEQAAHAIATTGWPLVQKISRGGV